MPRFYFHIHDGVTIEDETGTELASITEAKGEAIRVAAGIIQDRDDPVWNEKAWRLDVTGERGSVVLRLSFELEEFDESAPVHPLRQE